jgi:hypothetical protein
MTKINLIVFFFNLDDVKKNLNIFSFKLSSYKLQQLYIQLYTNSITMSNFKDSPHFATHNDYYTPKSAWENIDHILTQIQVQKSKSKRKNKNLVIFEAFNLGSNLQSPKYLEEMGYKVIADKTIDFLNDDHLPKKKSYDIIVSNPPFERIKSWKQRKENLKYKCIKKLFDLGKPFIILLNSTNIFSKWWAELVAPHKNDVKFIFPSKKIQYDKYEKGGVVKADTKGKNNCSFNSIYICFKVLKSNEWI